NAQTYGRMANNRRRVTISATRCAFASARLIDVRASLKSGLALSSQRKLASQLSNIALSDSLSSWAVEAASAPTGGASFCMFASPVLERNQLIQPQRALTPASKK